MKDAKGHGSDSRGGAAHQKGVNETAGRRYHVQVQPYSLAKGQVGKSLGRDMTLSQHNSLAAAGRALGSHISGNKSGVPQAIAGPGNGYRIVAVDKMTGAEFSRTGARTGTAIVPEKNAAGYSWGWKQHPTGA